MVFDVNDCQNVIIDVDDELNKCLEDSFTTIVSFTNNGPVKEELTLKTDSPQASLSSTTMELLPGVTKEISLTLTQKFNEEFVKIIADSALGSRIQKTVNVKSVDCYSILIDGPINESACSDWRSTFVFKVTNDGDADTFTAKTDMAFSQLSESSFELAHGETKELELQVAPGLENGEYEATLFVSSSKSKAKYTTTLNFERCYRVRLAAEPYTVCQCEDKAFPVDILNIGSKSDEYLVGLTSGPEWLLFDNQSVKVSGNSRRTVNPRVFTCDAEPGEYNAILNVISTSQNVSERSNKVCLNFTMLSKADCYTAILDVNDGEFVECKSSLISFNITNSGPVTNSFALKVEGPKWVAINPEVLTLNAHERTQSYLVISPPLNTVGQEFDVVIRAVSKGLATEKKIKIRIGAVGSKPIPQEWGIQLEEENKTLRIIAPQGAIVSILSPDNNVTTIENIEGYLLFDAEPGDWLISVEYAGETQTITYSVENIEPNNSTGLFSFASSNLLYAGAIILLAALVVAAYTKTQK